jgi:general secretion pathway protein G
LSWGAKGSLRKKGKLAAMLLGAEVAVGRDMVSCSLTGSRTSCSVPVPSRRSSNSRSERRNQRGVTRVELVMVAAVVGFAALGFGAWKAYAGSAGGEDVARQRGQRVLSAATDWKREHLERGCPSITQLQKASLLEASARAEDPWGQRYRIRCESGEVQVRSAGKDGKFETADDITLAAEPNT